MADLRTRLGDDCKVSFQLFNLFKKGEKMLNGQESNPPISQNNFQFFFC